MSRNSSGNGLRESLRNIFPNGITNGGSYSYTYSHSYSHRSRASAPTAHLSKDYALTADENLDLFSRNRRVSSYSPDSSSDASARVTRAPTTSAKVVRNGPDDLLFSSDGGKHDYDWLLTPPGTPLFPSLDIKDSQPAAFTPATPSLARSSSASKISRLSVSQPEINNSPKPARSSSVARSSISSQQSTFSNRSSAVLSTSSASISSHPRSSSSYIGRPSTPTSRLPGSRSSTPSKPRPTSSISAPEKPRPSQSSRPSTPTSRSHIPATINSAPARSVSRPSTPTRRPPSGAPSKAQSSSGRVSAPPSRPSSPSSRTRSAVLPEFHHGTTPNLRTTLPDRPLSAGRSRPSPPSTMKVHPEIIPSPRRHSSPIIARGRLVDGPIKARGSIFSQDELPEQRQRRASLSSEVMLRKPAKSTPTIVDGAGFAKSASRKSIDMGSRHTDLKGGNRLLSSTTLFPRSAATRGQPLHRSFAPESAVHGGVPTGHGNHESNMGRSSAKLTNMDIYESSRYEAMFLKEDSKNTKWLHSIDDQSDQESVFDCGFESLPEPFAL